MDKKKKSTLKILRNIKPRMPKMGEILLPKAHLLCLLSTKEEETALQEAFAIVRPHLKPHLTENELQMLNQELVILRANFTSRCKSMEYNLKLFKEAESDWLKSTVRVPLCLLLWDSKKCANCQTKREVILGKNFSDCITWKARENTALQALFGGFLKKNGVEGYVNNIPSLCMTCNSLLLRMQNVYEDFKRLTERKSPIYLLLGKPRELIIKSVSPVQVPIEPSEVQLEFSLMHEKSVPHLTKASLLCLMSRRQAALTLDEAIPIVRPHLKPHLTTKELLSLRYALLRLRNEFLAQFEVIQIQQGDTIHSKMQKFKAANEVWLSSTVQVPSCLLKEHDGLTTTEPGPTIRRCFNCQCLRFDRTLCEAMEAFQTVFEGVLKLYNLEILPHAFPYICSTCDYLLLKLHKLYVDFMGKTVEHSPIHLLLGATAIWLNMKKKPEPSLPINGDNDSLSPTVEKDEYEKSENDVKNRDKNPLATATLPPGSDEAELINKSSSITSVATVSSNVHPQDGDHSYTSRSAPTEITAPESPTEPLSTTAIPEKCSTPLKNSLNKLAMLQHARNDTFYDNMLGETLKAVSEVTPHSTKIVETGTLSLQEKHNPQPTKLATVICILSKRETAFEDAVKLVRPHLKPNLNDTELGILRRELHILKGTFKRMFKHLEQSLPNTSTFRQMTEFNKMHANWLHSTIRVPASLVLDSDRQDVIQEPEPKPNDPIYISIPTKVSTKQPESVPKPQRSVRAWPNKTGTPKKAAPTLEFVGLEKSVSDSIRNNVAKNNHTIAGIGSTIQSPAIQSSKIIDSQYNLPTLASISSSTPEASAPRTLTPIRTEISPRFKDLLKRSCVNTVEAPSCLKIRKLQKHMESYCGISQPDATKLAPRVNPNSPQVQPIETAITSQEMDVPNLKKADLLICLLGKPESAVDDAISLVRPNLKSNLSKREMTLLRNIFLNLKVRFQELFKTVEQKIPDETIFQQMKKFGEIHADWLKSTILVPSSLLLLASDSQGRPVPEPAVVEINLEPDSMTDIVQDSSSDIATVIELPSSTTTNTLPNIDITSAFKDVIDLVPLTNLSTDMDADSVPEIIIEPTNNHMPIPDNHFTTDPEVECPTPSPTFQIEIIPEARHTVVKKCGSCNNVLKGNVKYDAEKSLAAFKTVFRGVYPQHLVKRLPSSLPEICDKCYSLLLSLHKQYIKFMNITYIDSPIRILLKRSKFWKTNSISNLSKSRRGRARPRSNLVQDAAKYNSSKRPTSVQTGSTTTKQIESSSVSNTVNTELEVWNKGLKHVRLNLDPVNTDEQTKAESKPEPDPTIPVIVPTSIKSLSISSSRCTTTNIDKELDPINTGDGDGDQIVMEPAMKIPRTYASHATTSIKSLSTSFSKCPTPSIAKNVNIVKSGDQIRKKSVPPELNPSIPVKKVPRIYTPRAITSIKSQITTPPICTTHNIDKEPFPVNTGDQIMTESERETSSSPLAMKIPRTYTPPRAISSVKLPSTSLSKCPSPCIAKYVDTMKSCDQSVTESEREPGPSIPAEKVLRTYIRATTLTKPPNSSSSKCTTPNIARRYSSVLTGKRIATESAPEPNPSIPVIIPSSVKSLTTSSSKCTTPNTTKQLNLVSVNTNDQIKTGSAPEQNVSIPTVSVPTSVESLAPSPLLLTNRTPNVSKRIPVTLILPPPVPSVKTPSTRVIRPKPAKLTYRYFVVANRQVNVQPVALRQGETSQTTTTPVEETRATLIRRAKSKTVSILRSTSRTLKSSASSTSIIQRKPNPGVLVTEKTHSTNLPSYNCRICGQPIEGKRAYDKHILSHDVPLLPCPHCELAFRGSSLLQRHIQITHSFSAECESVVDDQSALDISNESEQFGFFSEFVKVESDANQDGFYSETGQLDLSTL